eukprot:maker-scaffold865_size87005-snap-gene-0.25 protein:Tk05468 transcript:maker-scaffold865_size87005-snap-gene-0.25-mRNA-1 annotation:"peroxisome assembly factor 2"
MAQDVSYPLSDCEVLIHPEDFKGCDIVRVLKTNQSQRPKLHTLKRSNQIPPGSMRFHLSDQYLDICYASPIEKASFPLLEQVSIQCTTQALKTLKQWLNSCQLPIAMSQGMSLRVATNTKESDYYDIVHTSPYFFGLVTHETVILQHTQSPIPQTNALDTHLKWRELSSEHAQWILRECGLERNCHPSTTVFVPGQKNELSVHQIRGNNHKPVCVRCVSAVLPFAWENEVFITPELKKTLSRCFSTESMSGISLTTANRDPSEVQECQVSFLRSPELAVCSSLELVALLHSFFNARKLVLMESVCVVFIQDFLSKETQRLSWLLAPNACLRFTVNNLAPLDVIGGWISKDTKMVQNSNPITLINSKQCVRMSSSLAHIPEPMEWLPRPLQLFQLDILKKIQGTLLIQSDFSQGLDHLFGSLAAYLGFHLKIEDCAQMLGDTLIDTQRALNNTLSQNKELGPTLLVLKDIYVFARNRDGDINHRMLHQLKETFRANHHPPALIIVATSPRREMLETHLVSIFTHHVRAPDLESVEDRLSVLEWACKYFGALDSSAMNLDRIAQRSLGFEFVDLFEVIRRARERNWPKKLDLPTLELCVREIQEAGAADTLGTPSIPQVRWGDVGGLEEAKREIKETIDLPMSHPELIRNGLKRSGVLLHGPPGTGKTLLAKVVASECNLNFLSVKGPELINPYVGQSEENIRDIFIKAKAASPCIVFFDELDALAPNRGNTGDSAGVMDRIVSQLLTQLDEMANEMVFVIGATNRPDMIDSSLLRPGRFDRLVHLGAADSLDEKRKILSSVTQKVALDPKLSLDIILDLFPKHLTGADITAIVSAASYQAIGRVIQTLEANSGLPSEPNKVVLTQADFKVIAQDFVPTI